MLWELTVSLTCIVGIAVISHLDARQRRYLALLRRLTGEVDRLDGLSQLQLKWNEGDDGNLSCEYQDLEVMMGSEEATKTFERELAQHMLAKEYGRFCWVRLEYLRCSTHEVNETVNVNMQEIVQRIEKQKIQGQECGPCQHGPRRYHRIPLLGLCC